MAMNVIPRCCATLLAVVTLAGCRTGEEDFPRIVNEPMPVSSEQRSKFGVIGVLPTDLAAHFEFGKAASPLEAGRDIGTKAIIGLADSSMETDEGHPGRQLGDLAFSAALGGIIGVFGGLLAGVPEADVKRAQTAMSQALRDNPLESGIQSQLERLAISKHSRNVVAIPETFPAGLGGNIVTKDNLRPLAGLGIDSLLCLRVNNERFVPDDGINPPMAIEIDLRMQIVRIADGQVLFDQVLDYEGYRQTFSNWGADHAKLFRKELKVAQSTFSGVIFEELSD